MDIQPQEPEAPPEPTPEELAAQEVEDLLASLTLEEKVGQLFFVRVPDTDAVSDVSTYHLGAATSSSAGIRRTKLPML